MRDEEGVRESREDGQGAWQRIMDVSGRRQGCRLLVLGLQLLEPLDLVALQPAMPICRDPGVQGRSHSPSFDQRRRPETLRTAIATAFFCPTNTTSRLPRVTPV